MDVSQIPAMSTDMATSQAADQADMLVQRKALDAQRSAADGVLQALPPPPQPPLPANPNIGRNVNTVA